MEGMLEVQMAAINELPDKKEGKRKWEPPNETDNGKPRRMEVGGIDYAENPDDSGKTEDFGHEQVRKAAVHLCRHFFGRRCWQTTDSFRRKSQNRASLNVNQTDAQWKKWVQLRKHNFSRAREAEDA